MHGAIFGRLALSPTKYCLKPINFADCHPNITSTKSGLNMVYKFQPSNTGIQVDSDFVDKSCFTISERAVVRSIGAMLTNG